MKTSNNYKERNIALNCKKYPMIKNKLMIKMTLLILK